MNTPVVQVDGAVGREARQLLGSCKKLLAVAALPVVRGRAHVAQIRPILLASTRYDCQSDRFWSQ